jgi:methyl-accepting chemotaxis protein
MSASIREVSTHASNAVQVAAAGGQLAASATDTVARLADSSAQIGAIVEVISAIAGQTHLLALNAAIEAARAGEAGESFAVVADEVKQLSQQTAKATQDIAAQVEGIRASAREAADAIGAIVGVIEEINGFQITIAGAVEEQTANTSMIGRSVGEAARGTAEIARSVTGVAEAAQQTTRGAAETQRAAGELARMAAGLRTILAEFSGVTGGPTQP